MSEARRILKVDRGATKVEIRRAWRRVARRLHPDVNPDPRAAEAFKVALAAYRRLMGRPDGSARVRRPAATPAPAPFLCPECNDGFTHASSCPRCDVPVCARGTKLEPRTNAQVEAMIADLESPAQPALFEIEPVLRQPLMALVLIAFGIGQANIGLWPLAVMSLGFGLFAVALDLHGRTKPQWART